MPCSMKLCRRGTPGRPSRAGPVVLEPLRGGPEAHGGLDEVGHMGLHGLGRARGRRLPGMPVLQGASPPRPLMGRRSGAARR